MNNLRTLNRKIDAMLIMVIAGLLLGLAISYNYYQSRKNTYSENSDFAAELLAYNLPLEAARILENNIKSEPLSERSLKLRKALAEISMNELNDYDKALTQLVYIKTFGKNISNASDTESKIQYCLNKLGRFYDVERRNLLNEGVNPNSNTVKPDTVVQLGNKNAITLDEVKNRLNILGVKQNEITKEKLNSVVLGMAHELLLSRAANRENLKEDPDVLEKIKMFEKSIMIQTYLQKFVLKDLKDNDEQKRMQLLADEITKLSKKEELKVNNDLLNMSFGLATDSQTIDSGSDKEK